MKKANDPIIEEKNNGHKNGAQNFAERPSQPVIIQDQGKVNALKHVLTPPDDKSQMELSDWTEAEVESLAIMKVQGEYMLNQEIDCVERHIFWKSVLRRGVGSQLTEQTILLNRSQMNPMLGNGGMGGGDVAAQGMDM
jgi:hypothetical protein